MYFRIAGRFNKCQGLQIRVDMADDLSWFQNARSPLLQATSVLADLAERRHDNDLLEQFRNLEDKINSVTFNLAVVGEFKRGKSTLVNAFISEPLLPTAVVPLTSVTTIIEFGEITQIKVYFHDGTSSAIAATQLPDYVTEKGNPNNEKKVSRVEIKHPSKLLQDGVRLIDTPGVGSSHEHNTQTTYEFLPEIDAAIFLFSADQPASQMELSFLKDVIVSTPRLFLVQNKIDYLSSTELAESLEYLQATLVKHLSNEIKIYPISARKALALKTGSDTVASGENDGTGFDLLERDIVEFLANGKARTFIESSTKRVDRELNALKQLILIEQQSRLLPLESLDKAIASFREASAKITQEQNDTEFIVRGETQRLLIDVEKDLKHFVEEHKHSIVESMESRFQSLKKLDKNELAKTLQSDLLLLLQNIFDEWKVNEERLIASSFEHITLRFVERSNEIVQKLKATIKEHFGVESSAHFEIEPLSNKSRHRYAVSDPFDLALSSLPMLLPSALAKPIIHTRFLNAASSELSRNAGRLRADYQERLTATTAEFLKKFRVQVDKALLDLDSTLERAKQRHKQTARECEEYDKELSLQLDMIEEAKRHYFKRDTQ
ncbi:MAG: dynamin family protein [Candidatus Obscuribacterales bacterium]|nr:dynamin family protein [Candidatus Obscuribacterales bacterium]